HAETLTVNASNRILKFLEEPTVETTALLLTENKQSIIPTIRSRCQVLDLKPLNRALFREQLIELGVRDMNARLLSALTNDARVALDWNEEDTFHEIKRLVYEFINVIITDYNKRYLFIHQQWLVQIKNKEETYLALELLVLAFQ